MRGVRSNKNEKNRLQGYFLRMRSIADFAASLYRTVKVFYRILL